MCVLQFLGPNELGTHTQSLMAMFDMEMELEWNFSHYPVPKEYVMLLFSLCVCVTAERFTVQWDRVHITNHVENGTFTFQVSLFLNGTIHFAYREVRM